MLTFLDSISLLNLRTLHLSPQNVRTIYIANNRVIYRVSNFMANFKQHVTLSGGRRKEWIYEK